MGVGKNRYICFNRQGFQLLQEIKILHLMLEVPKADIKKYLIDCVM